MYGISGVLSALGGILFAGKNGLGDHTLGVAYELIAITAAVVGGCSLSGGIGSIRGTVLGLLLTQIVIQGTGQVAPAGNSGAGCPINASMACWRAFRSSSSTFASDRIAR